MPAFLYTFTDVDGNTIPDADVWTESDALLELEYQEYVSYVRETLSTTKYVVAWMYYNDEEDYTTAHDMTFNTEAQVHQYRDYYNSHGHLALDRVDYYENGELVKTEMVDERISTLNGWGTEPNPGDNL